MVLSKQSKHIFLIHAHSDKIKVHNLYARMIDDGLDVWLDSENIRPGQVWQKEINDAILKCDVVVVCLTKNFDRQHGYRHEELKLALEKAKFLPDDEIFIIPVRLEKCDMPESLRHLHRVDLFRSGGYKKLVGALQNGQMYKTDMGG